MINYKRHRKAIEKMYEDRATISRYGKGKKPNGETKQDYSPSTKINLAASPKGAGREWAARGTECDLI
ncbi:hypothetical protein [Paenibacillus thiaminolyticus]|uniref:hypothetical protein n=1 Tax=Paenibacillus thiaminolyticus TaxID=49283 RepID=UPI001F0D0C37|nr:hypothetical protein [Paenibacillus thiaminolyticus]